MAGSQKKGNKMTASFDEREWIDVKTDRVPMTDDPVLVCREDKTMAVGYYKKTEKKWTRSNVVAWMPLPEPYES